MQVFMAHAGEDKTEVKAIGSWLIKKYPSLKVWIDDWSMVAGDSLTSKLGKGIEKSDKLVVFLSSHSVESNWVRKEVSTGIVMELAEEKGLDGENFVVPVILKPIEKVPIMLRDKLYVDFPQQSSFDHACELLYRGIIDKPLGHQEQTFDNLQIKYKKYVPQTEAAYGLEVQFWPSICKADINFKVDVGVLILEHKYAFKSGKGAIFDFADDLGSTYYAVKCSNGIEVRDAFIMSFESNEPFSKEINISKFM